MKKIGLFLLSFILIVFLSLGSSKAASGVAYYIVTNPGEDMSTQINVNWHSDELDTYLLYTKADDPNYEYPTKVDGFYNMWSLPATDGTFTHQGFSQRFVVYASINGLTPNTKYMYKVGKGDTFSDSYYFTTASGDNTPFSFLSITDPQYANAAGAAVFNNITNKAYEIEPNIKFSTLSGDVVDRGGKIDQWEALFDLSSLKTNPIAVTPGNHEYYDASSSPKTFTAEYFNHFFKNPENGAELSTNSSYFFKYNNVLYISIDSENSSALNSQQEWFANVIEENFAQYIVVFMHRSFYGNIYGSVSPALQRNWQPLFDRYGVDLVLTGHDHVYTRSYKVFEGEIVDDSSNFGTYYVTMGPGGKKFYDPYSTYQDYFAKVVSKTTMANIISVDGTGLHMNVINEAGDSVDTFTVKNKRSANANTSVSKEAIMDSFNLVPGVEDQSIASLRFSSDFYGQLSTVIVKDSSGEVVVDEYLQNEQMTNIPVTNVLLNVESEYEVIAKFRDGIEMTKNITILNLPYFGEISNARLISRGDDEFAIAWTAYLPNDVLDNYKLYINGNLKNTVTRSENKFEVAGVSNTIKNDVQVIGYTVDGLALFTLDFTFGEDPTSVVITPDPNEATITEGEEVTITLAVEPLINVVYEIVGLDTNLEVISHLDNVFVLKANAKGEYVITFKAIDKEGTGSFSLTVLEKVFPVESISVSGNEKMNLSETQTLEITYLPENATSPEFQFASSNEAVLKVDQNGKVTPKSEGQAIITVSCGEVSEDFLITVINPVVNVTSITITGDNEMEVGDNQTLIISYEPNNATNATFTYSSSDEDVLVVNNLGKVSAFKQGIATITVTNGDVSEEYSITVVDSSSSNIIVTSITINGDSKMNVNDVQTLTITYEPENATNVNFTYLSSDSEVLTVDENGKVEALKEGSATITVSNKEISETITITVSPVKKGCGSSNAMMLLPLLGVALFIIRKRRFI